MAEAAASTQDSEDVAEYLGIIAAYEKEVEAWRKRGRKVLQKFKQENRSQDSRDSNEATRFNILWSNVQVLLPATFSRMPQPDISRRFRDNDPVGRVAALLLERALEFELKHFDDFRTTLENCIVDRLLPGRGTCWVRYEPRIGSQEAAQGEGEQITDAKAQTDSDVRADGALDAPEGETDAPPLEQIEFETSPVDYVGWEDFGHSVARTWAEVGCVWRVVYMSRTSLAERFGEDIASKVPMTATADGNNSKRVQMNTPKNRARIYELWDRESRRAVWLCKGYPELLDQVEDPLQLEDFWPCPRPLFASITNDSLIPTPDFAYYQDQARELDTISDRIDGLIKALKIRGCYDAAIPELRRLFQETGNLDLIPIKNWPAFSEARGLAGAISLVDLQPIVAALEAAYEARKECVGQVYELTGISDLLRGMNDPSATATAERQKGQFGTLRLRRLQREVGKFAEEILRIKAQIMCRDYEPQYLAQIGGAAQMEQNDQALVPNAIQMLKRRVLRDFRIEIETDSMVQIDEQEDKNARMEFLTAVTASLDKLMPAIQQNPAAGPVLGELFKFGVTGFKVGKTIEGALDSAIDALRKNVNSPPPPSPEQQKIQGQMQLKQADTQAQTQAEQQRAQIEVWQHQQEEAATAHREQMQQMMDMRLGQQRLAFEKWQERTGQLLQYVLEEMRARNRIEVAEIDKETTIQGAQISAATAATPAQPPGANS